MLSSIRSRLICLVALSAVLSASIAWLGVNAVGSLQSRTVTMMALDGAIAQTAAAVQSDVLGLRRYEKDMFLNAADATKVREYETKFRDQRKHLDASFATLDGLSLSAEDRARLTKMRADGAAYFATMDEVISSVLAARISTPDAANRALATVKEHIRSLEGSASEWGEQSYARMQRATAEVHEHAEKSRRTLTSLAVLGIAAGLVAAALLARSILVPLQTLKTRMEEIANGDGDLTRSLPEDRRDEFGHVARAFNVFVRKMAGVIVEVRSVSAQVRSAAEQLAETSGTVSSSAQHQASSLQEAAASIEQIGSSVQQSSENASEVQRASANSRSIALAGGDVIGKAVNAMSNISESSRRIGQIISTIDELAFQTNLLALNAAVEAARAGEQGRGFAVVAAEVRGLAQRSAAAAREIRDLIRDSGEKVDVGASLVTQSGQTLQEIVTSAKRVSDLVGEMVGASQQLSSAIEQVNQAMTEIDTSVQTSAAQAEELHATAHAMTTEAKRLDALMLQFKVHGEQRSTPIATPARTWSELPQAKAA